MYYVIEHSADGLSVIGPYYTEDQALRAVEQLSNDHCDYSVTKTISSH